MRRSSLTDLTSTLYFYSGILKEIRTTVEGGTVEVTAGVGYFEVTNVSISLYLQETVRSHLQYSNNKHSSIPTV